MAFYVSLEYVCRNVKSNCIAYASAIYVRRLQMQFTSAATHKILLKSTLSTVYARNPLNYTFALCLLSLVACRFYRRAEVRVRMSRVATVSLPLPISNEQPII